MINDAYPLFLNAQYRNSKHTCFLFLAGQIEHRIANQWLAPGATSLRTQPHSKFGFYCEEIDQSTRTG